MQQNTLIARTISLAGMLLVLVLAGCSPKTLTVTEVQKNAAELDGSQIRVRGWAYVRTEPYVGFIGCAPAPPTGTLENDVVVGTMFLLPEEDKDSSKQGIAISKSSLSCEGSHCLISCAPFDPGNMDYCGASRGYNTPLLIPYEMVGTLRVQQTDGESQLVLEDIKLSESRRLINETWEPIPTGTIEYGCP